MRDLLFKNLTSGDKKKRVVAAYEVTENEGIRSIIQRHFICVITEVDIMSKHSADKRLPSLYIFREHNNKKQREKFFCRVKGAAYVASNDRLFLVRFIHSLKIVLTAFSTSTLH